MVRVESRTVCTSCLTQAEHVLHIEQAVRLAREKAHCAQRALRIRQTAPRLVRDFDALADAGKQHRMVADDVAAANRGKADGGRIAFARYAFAGIHRAIVELAAERLGDYLAHRERRARRRIDLVTVMRLDDL